MIFLNKLDTYKLIRTLYIISLYKRLVPSPLTSRRAQSSLKPQQDFNTKHLLKVQPIDKRKISEILIVRNLTSYV